MSLGAVLTLSVATSAARLTFQGTENRTRHPVEDVRRFDDETLLRAWGSEGVGIGGPAPNPPRPAPTPSIRPEDYFVVEVDGPQEPDWSAFVCQFLIDDSGPAPTDAAWGPLHESRWHRAKAPPNGELRGGFRFASTSFCVVECGVWMARLSGASALFVNGEGFIGDLERRGLLGVPVQLREGDNQVFVAGIEGGLELEFWKPATRFVIGTWDLKYPSLEQGCTNRFGEDLVAAIFNTSNTPASSVHYHYGHAQCDDGHVVPHLSDWRDGGTIAPLGLTLRGSHLFGFREGDAGEECEKFLVPLCAYAENDADADRRVVLLEIGDAPLRRPPPPCWPDRKPDRCALLVYGTKGTEADQATSLAVARYHQQRLWYWSDIWPMLIPDDQFLFPEQIGIHEWKGTAFVFGNTRTNAVLEKHPGRPKVPTQDREPTLEVTSPQGSSPRSGSEQFGVLSAPDARTLRLLYAVDPFTDLGPHDRSAVFEIDAETRMRIVRLR